jgi:hypothetical protein
MGWSSERMFCSASVLECGLSVIGLPAVAEPCAIQMQSFLPALRLLPPDQSTITYTSKSGILDHLRRVTTRRSSVVGLGNSN